VSIRITRQDLAVCGYCARGARSFLSASGVTWSEFMKNGVDSGLLDEKNPMVRKVVETVKKREGIAL